LQLITLDELRARMPELRKRETTLAAQLDALTTQLHDAETYLKLADTLDGLRTRIEQTAEQLTLEDRQRLLRLVVQEVRIGADDVTIRHSIPTPTSDQPDGSSLRGSGHGFALGSPSCTRGSATTSSEPVEPSALRVALERRTLGPLGTQVRVCSSISRRSQ